MNDIFQGILFKYYRMKKNPFKITMYHWDLPQYISDVGGFMDPIIVEYFRTYADVLYRSFGQRVKRWITFNEPYIFCIHGYADGSKPPLIKNEGVGEYICGHNTLKAHAAAYHLYNEKYRNEQKGEVGICFVSHFFYPDKDVAPQLAEQVQQIMLGWFMNPIFTKNGGYPQVMIDEIARTSQDGISRLPAMSDEMKTSLIGAADFLALNYYTSRLVRPQAEVPTVRSWMADTGVDFLVDAKWKRGKSVWLYQVPQGLHDLLVWIKDRYNNPKVMITENGISDDGQLDDDDRVDYLKGHLAAVSTAISKDHCNVVGYTVWSIIDNLEWTQGYTEKFGIYAVNMSSPNKERIAKKSALFFKSMMKDKSFTY